MSSFIRGFEKRAALKKKVELQPHQKRVVSRVGKGESLLLYHGLGSGKTLSSIAATERPGKKVDVVVPASLRENYRKELQKFTTGKGPDRSIQSYEGAAKNKLPGGDVLVADEIQRINQPSSGRSQAIVKGAPKYKQRVLLSGTPIKNAPSELAPIIRAVNPEASGIPLDPTEFNKKFLAEKRVSPGLWARLVHRASEGIEYEPKNLPELKKAIHSHIDYHAPDKTGYPSTSEQIVKVPMSEEQHNIYATVTNKASPLIAWKVKHNMPLSKQESKDINAFMTAARIVSNTTAPYGGKTVSPKFERASMDLEKHLSKNPRAKALVYSNYLSGGVDEYSKHLAEKGISHHVFTGSLSDKQRKQMVNDYNTGRVKALLISGAGSEGLDLKGTRVVQVLEPHWNKARVDQAIGRAVRYKSHAHLPPEEQHVHIMHYHSTHAPSFVDKIFHTTPNTSADEFLHGLSQKKEKINQAFLDVLKAEGERASKKWEHENVHPEDSMTLKKTAFEVGFEKKAYDIRALLKPITKETLSSTGLRKLKHINIARTLGGSGIGAAVGATAGADVGDKGNKSRNALVGTAVGAMGGAALGRASGSIAGKRLIRDAERKRLDLLGGIDNLKSFYKKDLGNWKGIRRDLQGEVRSDLHSVPLGKLHPHIREQVEGALKQRPKEWSKDLFEGGFQNRNPRIELNYNLEKYTGLGEKLRDLNTQGVWEPLSARSSTTPLFRTRGTASSVGIRNKPAEIAKSHPSYAKAGRLDQLQAEMEAMKGWDVELNPNLQSIHRQSRRMSERVDDFFRHTENAHNSKKHWDDYKRQYEDFFGGSSSGSGSRGRGFGSSFSNHEEHLKTLGLDIASVKSQEDIKKAWKTLARKHHPDLGGKKEDMQKINQAMDELKNSSYWDNLQEKNMEKNAFFRGFEKKAWSIPDRFVVPIFGGAVGAGVGAATADEGKKLKGALSGGAVGTGLGFLYEQGHKGFGDIREGLVEASWGHRMPWDKF